jgi:ankyrin repeat protein
MKKFLKPLAILVGLYIVVSFTLSGTEAGVLTLQIGVKQNSTFLTRVFIALGANPKATGQDGMSALHFAGYLGADQVIPLLIEKGAPLNLQDKEGRTALHLAAYAGQIPSVSALMEHQADPEIKENVGGMTALHLAVSQKHSETVRVLLEKGANASPEEKNGYTPLFIAEHENLDDIVAILEKHDAR